MSATITIILLLLVVIVVVTSFASRIRLPYAILLVLVGILLGFIPGLPRVRVEPDLILLLFLPPLVYASAWQTSWHEFHSNLRPILLLAVGLVLVTTTMVAVVAHLAFALPWPVAFVLGAVLSPTDAVAASATAQSMGLARRTVTILEGESMVNDATGLVVYRFAVAVVVTGTFSLWQASLQFVIVSLGGLLLGLILAWPLAWLHRHLDDASIEITITLLTPYAAYLIAEELQVSGVLAALTAGLYLSRQSSRFFSANTRLQAYAVWGVLTFLLNGLLFLLIGVEWREILENITAETFWSVLGEAALVSATVIIVRLVWVFLATYLLRLLSPGLRLKDPYPGWRNVLIIGWTGLRGGISLAAALALPLGVATGQAFPERNLILVLTFGIILATLVGQGLSLIPLIRFLHVGRDSSLEEDVLQAQLAAANSALARLEELSRQDGTEQTFLTHLHARYEQRIKSLTETQDGEATTLSGPDGSILTHQHIRQEVLRAQREAVITLRDQGRIDDEALRIMERELDLEEQRLYV
jgi:CPA1 family monovalent cation:H+ antiporter